MNLRSTKNPICILAISIFFGAIFAHAGALAADKLVVLYSARSMSQSMPWIAQEAGLLKKYDLEMQLVYVAGGPPAAAAALAGDTEVTLVGGVSIVRPFVQGSKDLAFIGAIKNILTHSILAKPSLKEVNISRPRELVFSSPSTG